MGVDVVVWVGVWVGVVVFVGVLVDVVVGVIVFVGVGDCDGVGVGVVGMFIDKLAYTVAPVTHSVAAD